MRPQLPTAATVLTALLLTTSSVAAAGGHGGHGSALAAHKRQVMRSRSAAAAMMHGDLAHRAQLEVEELERRAGAPVTVDTSAVAGQQTSAAQDQPTTAAQEQTTSAAQQETTSAAQPTTSAAQQTTTQQQQQQPSSSSQPQQVTQSTTSQQQQTSSVAPSSTSTSTPATSVAQSTSYVTEQPTQSSSSVVASSSSSGVTSTVRATVTNAVPSLISNTHTASSSASAGLANASSSKSSGGLSKTALIVIIVVACSVVAVAAAWTIFRKWKLSPTKRFDARMKPLDFSPTGGEMADAAYYEKTRRTSADYARQAYVNELDDEMYEPHAGGAAPYAQPLQTVPSHDFTAGAGAAGVAGGGEYGYPPSGDYYGHHQYTDYPPEDHQQGGLHRQPTLAGNNFAGAGAYHTDDAAMAHQPAMPQGYYGQHDQEVLHDGQYAQGGGDNGAYLHREPSLGRPTRGEGPYAAIPAAAAAGFGGSDRPGRPLA